MFHLLESWHEVVETRLGMLVEQSVELSAVLCDKLAERRDHLVRGEFVETRKR